MADIKETAKRFWEFLWYDDSVWSWLVNVILAFFLIKFLVYPGLGLLLGTGFPIVAVVSSSMEHPSSFDSWWDSQHEFYDQHNITKEQFRDYRFRNGFNKGDVMVLVGKKAEDIRVGDVIVFDIGRSDPIIHRTVEIRTVDGKYYFHTKGDHNSGSLNEEVNTPEDKLYGKAAIRIPFLGWVKIIFVSIIQSIAGAFN